MDLQKAVGESWKGFISTVTHCQKVGRSLFEVTSPYPKVRGVEISWSNRESKNCCLRVGEEIAGIVFQVKLKIEN